MKIIARRWTEGKTLLFLSVTDFHPVRAAVFNASRAEAGKMASAVSDGETWQLKEVGVSSAAAGNTKLS